jgi:hypothetical protein
MEALERRAARERAAAHDDDLADRQRAGGTAARDACAQRVELRGAEERRSRRDRRPGSPVRVAVLEQRDDGADGLEIGGAAAIDHLLEPPRHGEERDDLLGHGVETGGDLARVDGELDEVGSGRERGPEARDLVGLAQPLEHELLDAPIDPLRPGGRARHESELPLAAREESPQRLLAHGRAHGRVDDAPLGERDLRALPLALHGEPPGPAVRGEDLEEVCDGDLREVALDLAALAGDGAGGVHAPEDLLDARAPRRG